MPAVNRSGVLRMPWPPIAEHDMAWRVGSLRMHATRPTLAA